MRITLDTNFFVSATQWEYSVANKVFSQLISDEKVELFTTQSIFDELKEVLIRDFNQTEKYIDDLIANFMYYINLAETTIKIEAVKDDPDDNMVLECAVSSKSQYIISYDKHLLKLKEDNGINIKSTMCHHVLKDVV